MNIFSFDNTFEGLLTLVFESYQLKLFPDEILSGEGSQNVLFCSTMSVKTDDRKASGPTKQASGKRLSKKGQTQFDSMLSQQGSWGTGAASTAADAPTSGVKQFKVTLRKTQDSGASGSASKVKRKLKWIIFWHQGMEASAKQDEQFLKWITSTTAEIYWEYDENGERVKLKPGWEKDQKEFDRITGKGLKDK